MRYPYLLYFLTSISFISQSLSGQISQNIDLFANVKGIDDRYSGSWFYIAEDSTEYALLGAKSGTSFFLIEDPNNVIELDFVPGPFTNWREITVINHHAYVVTDVSGDNHSMQVIDLSFLPDSVHLVTSFDSTFTKGHIIQKDIYSNDPYVYVNGTTTTQGVHIIDVSNPESPIQVGLYQPGYYIHDCHVRGNTMFAAAFYEGIMDIVDISDKSNPVLISSLEYGGSNTHSSSLTEDGKYLLIADEKDGNPMRIWDIEDLSNPTEVAQYSGNLVSLVHNPYVRGNFAFISHNTEGLRVIDIADPTLPVEVGYYDTYQGSSGGFSGLWSACPYFPSGKIIGGDRHEGLFVWEFNNTRAGRLNVVAVDTFTQNTITTSLAIFPSTNTIPSDLNGNIRYGNLAGDYSFELSAPNYKSKNISFSLVEGENIELIIELVPENIDAQITGIVLDSATMEPIGNASIEIVEISETIFTNNLGNFENILSAGDFTLEISADSFFNKTINISLLPQDSQFFEIKLQREPISSIFDTPYHLEIVNNYPNPFSNFTTIDISNLKKPKELWIINSLGETIKKENIDAQTIIQFYKKDLPIGQYFYLIINSKKEKIGKGIMSISN